MKKASTVAKDMDEYLAGVPEPARSTLNKVRAMIRAAAPAGTTEGISYGIPAFKYDGPLVGFAAFKSHCSFFPWSGAVVEALKNDLKGYETSKGTIRFAVDKPLPAALVKKLVKTRLADKERKAKKK